MKSANPKPDSDDESSKGELLVVFRKEMHFNGNNKTKK
jgi:hypothetical protein